MASTFTLTGMEPLQAKLAQLGVAMPTVAAGALYREAERIMTRSKNEFVPAHHDVLKTSGQVQLPVIAGSVVTVVMGYGGAASAYALAVHEHLSEHSPPSWVAAEAAGHPVQFHPSGRGPKYLERPLNEARSGMDARLGADIAKEVARLAAVK